MPGRGTLYKERVPLHISFMKKMFCFTAVFLLLFFLSEQAMAAGSKGPGNLYPSPPAGMIGTPPSTIPQRTPPDLVKPTVPPASPPAPDYRGAVDPKTGHFFPSQGNGVFNPRTGEFYPRSGSGFINPHTGAFYPGVEKGGVPDSPAPVRP